VRNYFATTYLLSSLRKYVSKQSRTFQKSKWFLVSVENFDVEVCQLILRVLDNFEEASSVGMEKKE
jgi:hypothetical protein